MDPKILRTVIEARLARELRVWVISDTHFAHARIAEYTGRPPEHERLMIDAWRERISDGDLVLHLGDLALGKPELLGSYTSDLTGDRLLLRGNHDKRSRNFYWQHGFRMVAPFRIAYEGWTIFFSHRPLTEEEATAKTSGPEFDRADAGPERKEIREMRFPRRLNVHGHVHQRSLDDRRFVNVSVEALDYAPVLLSSLLEERLLELEPTRRKR